MCDAGDPVGKLVLLDCSPRTVMRQCSFLGFVVAFGNFLLEEIECFPISCQKFLEKFLLWGKKNNQKVVLVAFFFCNLEIVPQ